MRRIRYLSILAMLLCSLYGYGQEDFNPSNPDEPGQPPKRLVLYASPAIGGSTNGSGKYCPGEKVNIRAYSNSDYTFSHWSNTRGEEFSKETAIQHIQSENNDTLIAHFLFTPNSPEEPKDPALYRYFRLTIRQVEGGNASGSGKYHPGTSIYISCYPEQGYVFCGWYDEEGALVSDRSSFQYVTKATHETLTPRFQFDPNSPEEPPLAILSHNIHLEANEGGSIYAGSYRLKEGEQTHISASANTGYRFVEWLKDGKPYNKESSFYYTMEKKDVTFKAIFEFVPHDPDEPTPPAEKEFNFYLMSKNTKPSTVLEYPIYMKTQSVVKDMVFQLTFPKGLQPDLKKISVSEKAKSYQMTYTAQSDTSYTVSLKNGQMEPTNTPLLRFYISVPQDIRTDRSYQVKINQVSVTTESGETQTASTRNGRIYVYKNGDVNRDGEINLSDKQSIVYYLKGKAPENFVKEVADFNNDHVIDFQDCEAIVNIILKKQTGYGY